ncbi:MAG: helix-turn-helix domain-containing protein [Christensenellales bacterium]|jgi:repressor LexA
MHLGDLLRDKRQQLGMTMEQVAQIVGVSRATIQRWESGVTKKISSDKIVLLAEALELSVGMLHSLNNSEVNILPPPKSIANETTYSLLVTDDSMIPFLYPGDTVWFSPAEEIKKGDIVSVRVGNQLLIRYIHPQRNGYLLVPANHQNSPITINTTDGTMEVDSLSTQATFVIEGKAVYYQRKI